MDSTFFFLSYVLLWTLVIALFAAVFLLYRHHGQLLLSSRQALHRQGPETDIQLPSIIMRDLNGDALRLGSTTEPFQLFFFASTTCKPCSEAKPSLSMFAEYYDTAVQVVFVCRGDNGSVSDFTTDLSNTIKVVADPKWELGAKLRVTATPFALVVNNQGIVRAKGMPTTLESFESLIQQSHGAPSRHSLDFVASRSEVRADEEVT